MYFCLLESGNGLVILLISMILLRTVNAWLYDPDLVSARLLVLLGLRVLRLKS